MDLLTMGGYPLYNYECSSVRPTVLLVHLGALTKGHWHTFG